MAEAVLDDFQRLDSQSVGDKEIICSGMVRTLLDDHKSFSLKNQKPKTNWTEVGVR